MAADVLDAERRADAAVHVISVVAALAGAVALGAVLPRGADAVSVAAIALYVAGLIATFVCSALYNLAHVGRRKDRLRRLDHAMIFAMIAGTYTPVALLGIGGDEGRWLTAVVWVGAVGGAVLKLMAPSRFEHTSIVAYIVLGWAGLATHDSLLASMPVRDMLLLGVGGLLYTGGVGFHLATRLRYHRATWHVLVAAAATCHYAVVLHLAANAP